MTRPDGLSTLPAVADPFASRRESAGGGGAPRDRLAQIAAEFESMLMLEMIKQMRRSMLGEEQGAGGGGEGLGADTFSSTIDSELARYLANAGGLGLQTTMLEAWDRRTDAAPSPDALHALGPPVSPAAGSLAAATAVSAARPVRVAPAVAVDTSDDSLQLDIAGKVSSSFGWRNDPLHGRTKFHGGIDLAAAYGTAVPVAAGGTVVRAGEQGAYGLSVVVRHAGGYESRYAHLSSVDVAVGDTIEKGAVLGRVGSTGRSTAPHLHFEVTRAGQRVDPERFVRNLTSDTKGQ